MTVKRLFVLLMATAFAAVCMAASYESLRRYEIERDMPLCLDSIKRELTYPLAWGNSEISDFNIWRQTARDKVIELMLAPPPRANDYDVIVIGEEKRDGYTARKIEFNISRYSRITAYLLVPDGVGPFPGIIALHDHGGHYTIGKEKMIRPFDVAPEVLEDCDTWVENLYEGSYVGDFLARNGYVVLSTDALFWGDRGRKEGPDGNYFANVAGNFMMLGRNMSAWMTFEDMYATEFLSSIPYVNSLRIGCVGLSMGAYRSWMLAALSPLIKASVAVCWMTTTDVQLSWEYGLETGGFANNLIGVRNYLDYPHIASLACPNHMYFINGETDVLFKAHSVRDAYDTMHKVWDSQGVGDRLKTELLPMGHAMPLSVQEKSLKFLDEVLKDIGPL